MKVQELQAELLKLREENTQLKFVLLRNGISWDGGKEEVEPLPTQASPDMQFSTADKIKLFQKLFRGRSDVYPLRWESAKGRSGYSPACGNEWRQGICLKPKVKCGACENRQLLPVTDQVIFDHLVGKQTVGVYPLLTDDTCHFLAMDFDGVAWREDVSAVQQSCKQFSIPAAVEISRSGEGAHIWIFFANNVQAYDARRLGAALISHACANSRQLALSSYDRLFPNQDTMPQGGFGNLIALPLQKQRRQCGCTVFVDENFIPYQDQWKFLNSIQRMTHDGLQEAIETACAGKHPLDVAFPIDEENSKPWERSPAPSIKLSIPLPEALPIVIGNQIFISKKDIPQQLLNKIIRLAAFQNPEFYKSQAMRLSVWNIPRIIGCAENHDHYISVPRGCLDALQALLSTNNIKIIIQDERLSGKRIAVKFTGILKNEQKKALAEIRKKDVGILNAPTAFGKTVTAIALIAKRKVSTLIIVNRGELIKQWEERIVQFLDCKSSDIGKFGGGKKKPTGIIDIATFQTLSKTENIGEFLDKYGQVIVDECHHVSAVSFEQILKNIKSRYICGLTATPVRRDGHHPIIFMQCGEIVYSTHEKDDKRMGRIVMVNTYHSPDLKEDDKLQDIIRCLTTNECKNNKIISDIENEYKSGGKILVLSERTEHIELLYNTIIKKINHCYMLHGRLSKKQRTETIHAFSSLDGTTPRIIFATGRLIGEGFDHAPLDTLFLAMPISWKGTLQQYAGRLHREHPEKNEVRIYDYVEENNPILKRMWEKRRKGYTAIGYSISNSHATAEAVRQHPETVNTEPRDFCCPIPPEEG